MSSKELLNSLQIPEFRPLPFLESGMRQTIASAYWPNRPDRLPRETSDIELGDGDQIRIVENRPATWKDGDRIVVAIHGLASHSQSKYLIRLSNRLFSQNVLILRVNLRGCGIGFGLAKLPYHSGRSEDVRRVLEWAAKKHPRSPVTLVGYSLGGNISLKLAGEDSEKPTGNLDSVAVVSPPVNLSKTAVHLKNSSNLIFDQFFVWKLRYDISKLHKNYPELEKPKIPLRLNLTDFDEIYTAPRSGFKNAQDYYEKSSSAPFVPSIKIKGLILCSEDDPIIDASSVSSLKLPQNVDRIMTKQGGHVGFISRSHNPSEIQWMDRVLSAWVQRLSFHI